MFQCALPSHGNISFRLPTQKHTPSLPKLKKRTLPPCVLSHIDNQQHGKSQVNFTKVEASDKCRNCCIVQLFSLSTRELQWRKEQLVGLCSAVGHSHKHGQNSEQNGQEKARRFSAPKLSELLKWEKTASLHQLVSRLICKSGLKQVQLIEFGGVLESCGLRSIWDKITSQNTAASPCSPLHTPAPHSSLHKSVFRYTHRTSANAPPVRATVEESNYLPVKERGPLNSPAVKERNQPRTQVHATVAHLTRGRHETHSAQPSTALVPSDASSYLDPMVGGSLVYHKRLAQMAAQVCETVQWERRRAIKKQRMKTPQKSL